MDMWNRTKDNGKTVAELFAQYRLPVVRSDNNRQQGHLVMRNMLHSIPLTDPYVISMFPKDGAPKKMPGLMIFDCCKAVIEDIRDIQSDEKNPNDCAKQPHDVTHSVDMCRYFCISRVSPAEQEKEEVDPYEEENRLTDMETYMTGGEITEAYMSFGA